MGIFKSVSFWTLMASIAALLGSPLVLNLIPADVAVVIAAAGNGLAAFAKSILEHIKGAPEAG